MDGLNEDYRWYEGSSSESYAKKKARDVLECFAWVIALFLVLFLVSWIGAKFSGL